MYKKYYPVKSSADIVNMDIADKRLNPSLLMSMHIIRRVANVPRLLDARNAGGLTFIQIRNILTVCAKKSQLNHFH